MWCCTVDRMGRSCCAALPHLTHTFPSIPHHHSPTHILVKTPLPQRAPANRLCGPRGRLALIGVSVPVNTACCRQALFTHPRPLLSPYTTTTTGSRPLSSRLPLFRGRLCMRWLRRRHTLLTLAPPSLPIPHDILPPEIFSNTTSRRLRPWETPQTDTFFKPTQHNHALLVCASYQRDTHCLSSLAHTPPFLPPSPSPHFYHRHHLLIFSTYKWVLANAVG